MANTWINETENDIEVLQFRHEDITRISLRNMLHNFKCFQENPRRNCGMKFVVGEDGEKPTQTCFVHME